MIEFKNVYMQYVKSHCTLFDFSYQFESNTLIQGDIYNGANSILRIISKIDKDFTGEVYIDNKNIKAISDKDLSISYLPSNPVFFNNKSVLKNLLYPFKIRKINKKSALGKIDLTLKKYNLEHYKNLKINRLLLSEKKIIALIRSILIPKNYYLIEDIFEDKIFKNTLVAHQTTSNIDDTNDNINNEKNINISQDKPTTFDNVLSTNINKIQNQTNNSNCNNQIISNYQIIEKIIFDLAKSATIIATTSNNNTFKCYENFNKISLFK